ncbi:MAG: NeuD/PglB/VioB family sugar acetyltransferase [Planctomycetes bacterium]|nr:NeuD/PglB/VioB family sugar acetyltransferase [Planctomycetota bacterium]
MSGVSPDSDCIVLGGGQHAKVIIDAMLSAGMPPPCGVLDCEPNLHGRRVLGVPVLGGDEQLESLVRQGVVGFVVGVGSIGDVTARRRVHQRARSLGLAPVTVRHPAAYCSRTAGIGPGSQILAGAIVNTEAEIGENVLVNTGAIVEHDCVIEPHAHIATGARLAGGVRVGAGAHVGAGAVVREGITIGPGAVVGAGAVVIADVEEYVVVVGVPARKLRKLAA